MTASPARGERRQVTALFCDLVDSVSLTVRLGAEDMMHVLDLYFAACDGCIGAHGGYIMQYMGDGVLAYFGYPAASEDDAAQAVRAGLALRDAVRLLDPPGAVSLQLRVGIATGQVVTSDLMGQGEARKIGIVGDTPNLAARLQALARPDSVVVARATQRITRGMFTYRDLGSFALKGFDAAFEAFEAMEVTGEASRYRARTQGVATPMVGRDRELALLLDCWAAARAGRGQVVVLRGEPGIGKSRLVEELRARADDTPHAQSVWYCAPDRADSALAPASRALARAAGFERDDTQAARRQKLAGLLAAHAVSGTLGRAVLADLLGITPDAGAAIEAAAPEKRKEVLLETLLGLMERAAPAEPVLSLPTEPVLSVPTEPVLSVPTEPVPSVPPAPALFVLEDAHWADATTLELLDRAVRRAADRPWLILVTGRAEYQPSWRDLGHVRPIVLDRLTLGDAGRICAHLGAETVLPPAAVRQIIARCDGVPLFIEEMVRSVIEAAALAPGEPAAVLIPMSVQDSLVSRLDRLGPARWIANLGAVIGRRFSYALLAAVAARPEAELRQGLRALALSGLVERIGLPPTSEYLFRHALIRDAAYASLLQRERQALHGQIAAVLRDRFAQTQQSNPEMLAYHFTESGAVAEAVPLWAAAGARAAARAAYVEAVGHLQTALDLLRQLPADGARAGTELQLLIGLAVSLAASRGYAAPEVGGLLGEALAICDALGDAPELFAVLCGITLFMIVAGDIAGAEATARRTETIAARTGLPEHRIQSGAMLGYILFVRGDPCAAVTCLQDARHLYAAHDGARLPLFVSQDPLVVTLASLLQVLRALDDQDGAALIAGELASHVRSLGRPYDLAWGLAWLAHHELASDAFARAQAAADEALELCRTHGYPLYEVVARSHLAYAQGHLGQPDQALRVALGTVPAFKALGMGHFLFFYLGELAALQAATGNRAAALRAIDEALAAARRLGEECYLSPLLCRRALILAGLPQADPAAATAALREALAVAERQGATAYARQAAALLKHA